MPTDRNTTVRDRHRRRIARGKPGCAIEPCLFPGVPIDYEADHLDPLSFVVDHIVPRNRGGADTIDNKQPAHRACNRAKSDKLPEDDAPVFVTARNWL